MASTRKRARTAFVPTTRVAGSRRPIDKSLKTVTKAGVTATQVDTTLITATFPCTIVGLRWSLSVFQDGGTGDARGVWAVVIVRDGNATGSMATTDGGDFYTPEQDVLAFGHSSVDNNVQTMQFEGTTKTMRKLLGGDKLVFSCKAQATNTSAFEGIFQFFCKT